MSFRFHQSDPDFLLPLRIGDLIPQDDISWIILEIVDRLDVTKITVRYSDIGTDAFDPRLLLKLIFYGVATGNRSSRKIARLALKDLGGMMLCGVDHPSWRTVARFIQNNQNEVSNLFVQVLQICISLGMVSFGHLSLDGTKIKADASKFQYMTAAKMQKKVAELTAEIEQAFQEITTNDVLENQQYGEKTADVLPKEISEKKERIEKLNYALNELKTRAKAKGEAVKPGDQYNFSDPDSRPMKTSRSGIQQCYNHQIIVDSQERVITAYTTSSESSDAEQLKPTLEESKTNTGKNPEKLSSDTGYFSGTNLAVIVEENIDGYICPERKIGVYHKLNFKYDSQQDLYICPDGRELKYFSKNVKTGGKRVKLYSGDCSGCPHQSKCTKAKSGNRQVERDDYDSLRERMRAKFETESAKEIYSHRKELPEPVFGQIKQQQNFHQHLYKGLKPANNEFGLACLVYNIKRIWHKYNDYQGTRDALDKLSLIYDPV